MTIAPRVVVVALAAVASLSADQKKLTMDQRAEIIRALSAEYATVKSPLPRSKKPLDFNADGTWDKQQWIDAGKQFGPAARVGDTIQITHIEIERDSILFEINHGNKRGGSRDNSQVGVMPIPGNSPTNAPGGTTIALRFNDSIGEITSAEIKKILAPVLDFDKHSATEEYSQTLSPETRKAIIDKKPVAGMDRDEVIMAIGKPLHKTRETKDGVEYEDWIYGTPPGRVTFVTFAGAKVVKVKETYAGLGGSIAETPTQP